MSNIIWTLLVGLVAGVLAKAIMPGSKNEPGGWIMTILLGIGGGFVGGFLGSLLNLGANGLIAQIIFATVGAIILIAAMRFFTGRRAAV